MDGSEPAYIHQAIADGVMPWTKKILETRQKELSADCVIPSFTNPNNMSIVTGVPPQVHGICGNFYYDRENDAEVMMNEPSLLRADTIFKAFENAGAKVAVVTAKDKLRRLLGNKLQFGKDGSSICFSSERADEANLEEHGIENVLDMVGTPAVPSVYSAELSEFIFKAGVKIMETAASRPDIMYLSTTDYIQHKWAPGQKGANDFYAMLDGYFSQLDNLNCIIGITSDHGMNPKHNDQGEPNVIYLQDYVDNLLGKGKGRVILPITDPYVVHHGALGSFATVYLHETVDKDVTLTALSKISGIETALTSDQACEQFLLAPDRIGDLVFVSQKDTTIGTSADRHDLSGLGGVPLRSHGGISEQVVPMIFNQKVNVPPGRTLRNFDVFDVVLNHVE